MDVLDPALHRQAPGRLLPSDHSSKRSSPGGRLLPRAAAVADQHGLVVLQSGANHLQARGLATGLRCLRLSALCYPASQLIFVSAHRTVPATLLCCLSLTASYSRLPR